MAFVSAKEGPPNCGPKEPYTVQYFDEQGNMTIKSGGTKTWRNNNVGNLKYFKKGSFASRNGSIGVANQMAIFPDIETGRKALIKLLKGPSYCDLRLEQLSDKYDEENKAEHRRMLQSISKLDLTKKIKDLTPEEFEKLRVAMERIEGWEIGREDFIEKCYISGVHKKRGIIQEYLVKEGSKESWISKEDAIKRTLEGHLHATIVHLKNGTNYLRPEYGLKSFELIA